MTDGSDQRPPIRVLLAVGNPERERRLRDALSSDGLVVVGRCLDGPSLVEQAARPDVDVALASSDLHRLSAATLTALLQARLPVVLLAESVEIEKYRGLAHLMSVASADAEVATALRQALARGVNYGPSPEAGRSEGSGDGVAESENPGGRVIAVVSGKGAPGVTTLAIGLAAALANRGRRVVLVDADLRGGNVVGYLDLDPRRGILGLTFGGNGASEEARLEEELQEGPGFMVLAGIERPESRYRVSAELPTAAVTTLRGLFEDIVVDVGEVVGGVSPPTTDAILRLADRVLLVAGADLVALWNARSAARHLREGLSIAEEAVGVVLNRREGREHYAAREVERALGLPVLAVVREDRRAARRAIEQQVPITAVRGRAARELKALASRLAVEVPAAVRKPKKRWLLPFKRGLVRRA